MQHALIAGGVCGLKLALRHTVCHRLDGLRCRRPAQAACTTTHVDAVQHGVHVWSAGDAGAALLSSNASAMQPITLLRQQAILHNKASWPGQHPPSTPRAMILCSADRATSVMGPLVSGLFTVSKKGVRYSNGSTASHPAMQVHGRWSAGGASTPAAAAAAGLTLPCEQLAAQRLELFHQGILELILLRLQRQGAASQGLLRVDGPSSAERGPGRCIPLPAARKYRLLFRLLRRAAITDAASPARSRAGLRVSIAPWRSPQHCQRPIKRSAAPWRR